MRLETPRIFEPVRILNNIRVKFEITYMGILIPDDIAVSDVWSLSVIILGHPFSELPTFMLRPPNV